VERGGFHHGQARRPREALWERHEHPLLADLRFDQLVWGPGRRADEEQHLDVGVQVLGRVVAGEAHGLGDGDARGPRRDVGDEDEDAAQPLGDGVAHGVPPWAAST